MKKNIKATEAQTVIEAVTVETAKHSKLHDYREQLKNITNTVMELAKAAGRTEVSRNELLRETYNLVGVELDTFEGWSSKGGSVRKGQHAYLFWGAPVEKNGISFCPVNFLFAKEQVRFTPAA